MVAMRSVILLSSFGLHCRVSFSVGLPERIEKNFRD